MDKDKNYILLLNILKSDIENARLQITLTVNEQLFRLYWTIGENIAQQRVQQGWEQNYRKHITGSRKIFS